MMKALALACSTFLIAGCVPLQEVKATPKSPEQQAYVDKVMAYPLEVTVPKKQTGDAWGRAQSFIGKYSSMKLQSATDFIIQTYNAPSGDQISSFACGYSVTKTPLKDSTQITVEASAGAWTNPFAMRENTVWQGNAKLNAHILSYYIATGELPFPDLITK